MQKSFDPVDLAQALPVLVVDDQSAMRTILTGKLAEIGLQDVTACASPPEAVTALRHRRHGLILSDVEMSPVSGMDFLNFLRATSVTATIPFIFVTASMQFAHVSDAKWLKADGYLLKPFDSHTLRRTIVEALSRISPVREAEGEPRKQEEVTVNSRARRFNERR
jgi:two-component system, chemotaxis family, chemotaxis protein CheY